MSDAPPAAAPATPRPATPRGVVALLLLVLASAFALRLWDATQGLASGAHFDERFSMHNVAGILRHHEWAPREAFYPSLSYLPQTLVLFASEELHALTGIEALSIDARSSDGWSATAYLLVRLTNVVFGTWSLWLVFVVGRRVFGPVEGLLAAAALAAFPRHLISSTHFKPDILVTLLTLLTFWWTMRAVARPSAAAFARSGLGVGLATAAKYTGAGAAIAPSALAVAQWRGWLASDEDAVAIPRRRWLPLRWLVLAGVTAIVTFVALDPFLLRLLLYARRLSTGYAAAGADEGSDHWTVLRREGLFLLQHHGWVAAFLVLGMAGLAWTLLRGPRAGERPWPRERRLGALLLLVQIVGFAVLFAVGFPLFRGQNFLPVAPFTSLVAAWAMVASWRAVARRLPVLARPALAGALLVVPIALLVRGQLDEVYAGVVPSTWEVAAQEIATTLDQPVIREVVYEGEPGLLRWSGRGPLALPAPSLLQAGDAPRLADAELYRRDGAYAEAPRARASALDGSAREIAPRLFRSSGDTLELALHPWTPGAPLAMALAPAPSPAATGPTNGSQSALVAPLPATLATGTVVSLSLWVPRVLPPPLTVRIEPAGIALDLYGTDRGHGDQRLLTPRFVVTQSTREVRFAAPPPGPRPPRLEALPWSRQK